MKIDINQNLDVVERPQDNTHEIRTGLTLYDINKQSYKSQKKLSRTEVTNRLQELKDNYFAKHTNKYFSLLCNEKKDFTIFNICKFTFANYIGILCKELQNCIENRGFIYDINITEDGQALEIWLKSHDDSEINCYYFFPYDEGVIEI